MNWANISLTVALLILTGILIYISHKANPILRELSKAIQDLYQSTQRNVRMNKIRLGANLERSIELPTRWLRGNLDALISDLNEIENVKAESNNGGLKITYQLNRENDILQILEEETDRTKEEVRFWTEL